MRRRIALLLACAELVPLPSLARDYGQLGATFAIVEPDLLAVISARLTGLAATGAIDAANRQLAARTAARVQHPAPVAGIVAAAAPRAWLVDPTITVSADLRDDRGRVVVAKGTRVNPLNTVRLRQRLFFLDGDDPAQVAWATARTTDLDTKLILVRGAPLDLMRARQRRFFFDQGGTLTTRLGIRAVPATVEQTGRMLAVHEILLPKENTR